MQAFLAAFDYALGRDDAGAQRPQQRGRGVFVRGSRSLCAYARSCKRQKRLETKLQQSEKLIDDLATATAVRHGEKPRDGKIGERPRGRGNHKVWTPIAMLKAAFGHAKCEDARSSAAHTQCPTQFSCGTAAFWFRAATTHVQKVRDSLCQLFFDFQKDGVAKTCDGQCRIKKLQIEMDETTQMLRLVDPADDLGPIEGGFPVFLSRWSASWVTPRLAVLHEPILTPPVVLTRNDVPTTWAALNMQGPVQIFDFFKNGEFGLLFICADRHEVNIALAKFLVKQRPKGLAVVRHHCNVHECHRATAAAFARTEFVNNMFCTSAVLRNGVTFRNLLRSVKYMMRKNFRVRYTPPDETHRAHATQIMNNSYWVDVEGEYDSQSRIDKGKQLLHMLNGDWKSTKIVHHCTAGCCLDNEDAFRKSWAAVRATVFAERPGTPAMNKWTQ